MSNEPLRLADSKFYNEIFITQKGDGTEGGENSSFYSTIFVSNDDIGHIADDIYNSFIDIEHWVGGNPAKNIVSILAFPIYTDVSGRFSDGTAGQVIIGSQARHEVYGHRRPDLLKALYRVAYIKVEPTYKDFRAFSGYSRYRLFLPYYGYIELKAEDVVDKWIQVLLKPDFTSGKAIYIIGVTNTSYSSLGIGHKPLSDSDITYFSLMRIIETIEFQFGVDLPIGITNSAERTRNLILSATLAAASVAMVAAPVPAKVATSVATTSSTRTIRTKNPETKRMNDKAKIRDKGRTERTTTYDNSEEIKQRRATECFESGLDVLRAFNYDTQKSNPSTPQLAGALPLIVHLIEYIPNYVEQDENFNKLYGRPLGTTRKLHTLRGYTEISAIHIEGDAFNTATLEEIDMLEKQLTSGIFL